MAQFAVQDMASVRTKDLDDPVGSLVEPRSEIIAALDLLFTGI